MEKQAWQEEMPPLREWVQDPEGNALVAQILNKKSLGGTPNEHDNT